MKAGSKKDFIRKEIIKQAEEFVRKWMPTFEKSCKICGASNCINNETCIKCKCQF